METTCVVCNTKSYGMIAIYKHPRKLDEMFSEVSGLDVLAGDHLCIQCYEDLKFALEFKRKCLDAYEARNSVHREDRKRIEFGNVVEQPEEVTINEYEVLITSTSDKDRIVEESPDKTSKVSQSDSVEKKLKRQISPKTNQKVNCVPRKSPRTQMKSPTNENTNKKNSTNVKTTDAENEKQEREIEFVLSYDELDTADTNFKIFDPESGREILIQEDLEEKIVIEQKPKTPVVKPHKCNYCPKFFRSKNALEGHHRTHTGDRPFKCEHCSKGFAEIGNLRQHIRSIHLNERKYTCEKCKNSFKTHYSHQVHVRSCITKEKPYTCMICEKGFYSSGKLLLHTRTHTGERPYPCNYCSSAFKDSTALKRHVVRIHSKTTEKTSSIGPLTSMVEASCHLDEKTTRRSIKQDDQDTSESF